VRRPVILQHPFCVPVIGCHDRRAAGVTNGSLKTAQSAVLTPQPVEQRSPHGA